MIRVCLLLIVAIAALMIAPRAGYSGKVILKPEEIDAAGSKDWSEEVRENSRSEERKERREDRQDERRERREDIVDEVFE